MTKIKSIEERNDKNSNPMKVCEMEDAKVVYVNSKYEPELYAAVEIGKDVELVQDGKFFKIMPESLGVTVAPKGNYRGEQIKEAQNRKEHSIQMAQERTELIWAKRSAMEVLIHHPAYQGLAEDQLKAKFQQWTSFIINTNTGTDGDLSPF